MKLDEINQQLSLAAHDGSFEKCKKLLESKANIHYRSGGATVLSLACIKGSAELIRLLLNAKADINEPSTYRYPIIRAVQDNNVKILPTLIRAKADVNVMSNGQSPLFLACAKKQFVAVQMLLAANPKPNLNQTFDAKRITALHLACMTGTLSIVKALVGAKADVYKEDQVGFTPLRRALTSNHTHIMSYLLDGIVDINYYDKTGNTVMHYAARNPNLSGQFQFLIDAKGDVNAESKDSKLTPYLLAQILKNQAVVKIFEGLAPSAEKILSVLITSQEAKILSEGQQFLSKCQNILEKDSKLAAPDRQRIQNIYGKTKEKLQEVTDNIFHKSMHKAVIENNIIVPADMKKIVSTESEWPIFSQQINEANTEIEATLSETIRSSERENKKADEKETDAQRLKNQAEDLLDAYRLIKKELTSLEEKYQSLEKPPYLVAQWQKIKDLIQEAPEFQSQVDTLRNDLLCYKESIMRLAEKFEKNRQRVIPIKPKKVAKKKILKNKTTVKKEKTVRVKPAKLLKQPKKIPTSTLIPIKQPVVLTSSHQKQNITKNIVAAKILLRQMKRISLETLNFQTLNALKFSLIRILLNLAINQNQITRRPQLRNMRNTLHRMSLANADIDPYSVEIKPLQEQTQELAEALTEFSKLYKKDNLTDGFYLPGDVSLDFTSELLTRMASLYFDTRAITDQTIQGLLQESSGQAKYYWTRLIDLLIQPATPEQPTGVVSIQGNRLTIAFAILCQISSANEAKQTSIGIGNNRSVYLSSTLKAIANEWRHRGLSLERAADHLEDLIQPQRAIK